MTIRNLRALALAGSLAGATALGAGTAGATETWRLTQFAGETSAFYTLTTLPFVEKVAELTDGELVIEPFPAGVIAPPFEAYAAVRDGLADAGHLTPLYVVNEDPANSFYGGHPGGMSPEMMMGWLYNGGGKELLAEMRRDQWGMHSIPLSIGPGEVWHSHIPVQSVEDLKGAKFRTAGAFAEVLSEYFDAAPTVVPGSEVYTLLERKGIDIADWSSPSENMKAGLHNAAPYIVMPGAQTNAFMFELLVPAETWDALSDEMKQKVEAAAKLSTMETLLTWTTNDLEAMAALEEAGAQFVELPTEVRDAIREAGRDWAYKKAEEQDEAGNPWMRRIADSYYDYYDKWMEHGDYRQID